MGANLPKDPFDEDADFAPLAEINVTPFVDVVLVLLIIFCAGTSCRGFPV